MFKLHTLAAAFAAFAAAGAAQAATISYATAIDWSNNGTVTSANNRDVASNALGSPDGAFLSLGLSSVGNPGFAVFEFGGEFMSSGVVIETTFVCNGAGPLCSNHPEQVEILVGNDYAFGSNDFSDLSDFTSLGFVSNSDAQSGAAFAIPGTFMYLALVDRSGLFGVSTDGFDVESIGVELSPVPVPAALPMLAAAMAGFAFLARRRAAV